MPRGGRTGFARACDLLHGLLNDDPVSGRTCSMKPLEIPESLLRLADERGYRLDWTVVELPGRDPVPVWLCWDFAFNEFVTTAFGWISPEDALEYIEGASG